MIRFTRLNVLVMVLVFIFFSNGLFGFDLLGRITMHGKVVDADTLEPIDGAVVYAVWLKCRSELGSDSCRVGKVEEIATDSNGEWVLHGPRGSVDPGILRSMLGFLVPWFEPPNIGCCKSGYYPFHAKPGIGDFSAFAYREESGDIEGIALDRRESLEEWERYLKLWRKDRCEILVPMKDAERRLRELAFDFKYSEDARRVYVPEDPPRNERYKVIGLKRAVTPEEKCHARILGLNGLYPFFSQSLLMRELEAVFSEGRFVLLKRGQRKGM